MKISIFGSGYVGLVSAACLAEVGHQVCVADIDEDKINKLNHDVVTIFEPGLEKLAVENRQANRLQFTSSAQQAIDYADTLFIAVGTPPEEDGSADLSHVLSVARSIGQNMDRPKLVITKSTVPVGTSDQVRGTIDAALAQRDTQIAFTVASNPEFLKEGAAVADFMKPDRIIVGCSDEQSRETFRELYAPFNRYSDRMQFMDVRSAELTKYAANAMLATKISFINEIANLAEKLGADIEQVRRGIGSDPRIGYQFIYPGCGYGGSCFPKDVKALIKTAGDFGKQLRVLEAVEAANQHQKTRLFELISDHFGSLEGRVFAVWGLAFKPQTDDMREAPSRVLLEALWGAGARIQAYDPAAMEEAERIYGQRSDLTLMGTANGALQGADALVICTEWPHFKIPDFDAIRSHLSEPVVFDGRNLYEPGHLLARGICYYGIGRGQSVVDSNARSDRDPIVDNS